MPSRYIKIMSYCKKENREIVEIPRRPPNLLKLARATLNARAMPSNDFSESIWTAGKYELILKYLKITNYATGRTFDTIAAGASPFAAGAAAVADLGAAAGAASPSAGWSMFGTVRPSNSENSASR